MNSTNTKNQNLLRTLADVIGLRFLWHQIKRPIDPESDQRRPMTIAIWLAGILVLSFFLYLILFAITSYRYKESLVIIEHRINNIHDQLATKDYKIALSRVGATQRMTIPVMPDFYKPATIVASLRKQERYSPGISQLQLALMAYKDSLSDLNLQFSNFNDLDLSNVDFSNSILKSVDFRFTNLSGARFEGVVFDGSDVEGADFTNATGLRKDALKKAYYREQLPVLPDGIDPPFQRKRN